MIWRRLRVRGNTSLADLHSIIQMAMGWDNDYLHSFHIYGQDYGNAYEGGISFCDDAHRVSVDDFGFEVVDRFTYTYNFNQFWLCDIRIEAVDLSNKKAPFCLSGNGRQGDYQYYQSDELNAVLDIIGKFATTEETATVADIRPLIEHYEAVSFSRHSINHQLAESFAQLT